MARPSGSSDRRPPDAEPEGWTQRRLLLALVGIIVVLLVAEALRVTYSVSMPLALAFFLAATVRPIQKKIADSVPSWLGGLGLLAALLLVVSALGI
ncbi:MAG: hypothetical protein R3349_00615, partial [Geminicoccaceae bacterium]|nr:hypothetical protein [Geminicoccaceae bacterium]